MNSLATIFTWLAILTGTAFSQVLNISDVQRLAVENNLNLRSASQRSTASKWGVVNAVSQFLPRLDLRTSISRLDPYTLEQINYPADFFPGYVTTPKDAFESSLSLTVPVFNGGLLYSNLKAARAQRRIESNSFRKSKLDIEFAAVQSYLDYLRTAEFLEVQKKSMESSLKHLAQAKSQFELGQRSRTDFLRFEVDVAEKEQRLIELENAVRLAKLGLCRILDIDEEEFPELRRVDDGKFRHDYAELSSQDDFQFDDQIDSWFEIALEIHPDYELLAAREQLASADLWRARSQFLPKVNFSYNYRWEKDEDIFLDERTYWSAGVQIDFPLFTSLGNYSELRRSKAMQRSEQYSVEDTRKALRLQLISVGLQMRAALLVVVSAEKAREQAALNLELIEQRYNLGMLSVVELLDAETAHFGSSASYIDALYTFYTLSSQIESLVGRKGLTGEYTYGN